ncbi:EAL domain-containing protein [Cupriavidus basilensis]|uniref:bifunctional diguanylate cyclase/phosphodiesterase n=1 Tax=Cupriavidus basilensis TaxID=68895 RepID=UPI0039F669BA
MRKLLTQLLRPIGRVSTTAITLGALLLGLLSTIVVHSLYTELLERDARLRFKSDTDDIAQQIDTRIRLYTDVLVTMQALFGASDDVSREEFRDFVNGLNLEQRYPGFQTLNYAPYVPASELASFVASQRKDPVLREAGVAFSVHPAGKRPAYFVLTYVEPFHSNLPSIGIDMGAEPGRLAALERARDSGQAVSSGRLIFSEANGPHVGIALRLPVYRKGQPLDSVEQRRRAYIGSVGAGIRISGLLGEIAGSERVYGTRFELYDAGKLDGERVPPSPATLLYNSAGGMAATAPASAKAASGASAARLAGSDEPPARQRASISDDRSFQRKEMTQPFGGRRWLIVFSADAQAMAGPQRYLKRVVLGAGLIITALLAGLAYALSSSRSRALAVADGMTHSLRESQEGLAQAQRIAHLGDWRVDLERNAAYFSREMARLLGVRALDPTPDTLLGAADPRFRGVLRQRMQTALRERVAFELECPYRSSRGRMGWLHLIGHAHGPPGTAVLRGTAQDITQRKLIEQARAQEHLVALHLATVSSEAEVLEKIVRTLVAGMEWEAGAFWPSDAGRGLALAPVCRAREQELEPWLARRPADLQADQADQEDVLTEPHWYAGRGAIARLPQHRWLADGGVRTVFAFPLRKGTSTLGLVEMYSRTKRPRDPHALAMASAIASHTGHFLLRRQAEETLRFFANHDALTGLPNRLMFNNHLESSLARSRSRRHRLDILFVDLDQFKRVNDTMGHNAGDVLLRAVADRFSATLGEANLIARLGGDEFVVLVEPIDDFSLLHRIIKRIQAALASGFVINGKELQVTASIGVSSFPEDGNDAQTLLKHADLAMYAAKQLGKNGFQYYVREMSVTLQNRIDMESHLRSALEHNEFVLHYQPRISLDTNACTGVEALIRWHHPKLGMVMPADFIPVAEECGAIVQIGAWVLREACRQNAQWLADGNAPIRVSVNLSARQFADKDLRQVVLDALKQAGLPGYLLELELTESMVMRDAEQAARWLSRLKRTGVRLAIDDFGTGYSSLAYLSRFPIDTVKIDRSFIRYLPDSRSDAQITSAIIGLGHQMALEVVAEGVENEAQLDFLRREGCDEVQGYYFSRPMPAEDITAFLAGHAVHGLLPEQRPQPMRA